MLVDILNSANPVNIIGIVLLILGLRVLTHERAITNRRIIAKYGIISRRTQETLLNKIETVQVNQGIIQRIFGFARVKITGTGGSAMTIKYVADYRNVKTLLEDSIQQYYSLSLKTARSHKSFSQQPGTIPGSPVGR